MSDKTSIRIAPGDDVPSQVELTVARVDPWSVMKVSFLLSVAMGIAMVIAAVVLWLMVDGMHVFGTIDDFLVSVGAEKFTALLDYVKLPKFTSYATIAAVVNVVLMTAISTLGALIYNLIGSLVGGIRVKLVDE